MCFRRRHKKPKPTPKPTPGPPVPQPPKPPVGTLIQLVNRSTVVTDAECVKVAAALQVQVTRDYSPLYGIPSGAYTIQAVGRREAPNPNAWQVLVLDTSDQAGALGYHDVTPQGLPLGKVFAKTDQDYNVAWSTTASHELLEMLGDPNIDKTVTDPKTGWVYAYENCDAVENDEYVINGVAVSDFVTDMWFRRGKVDIGLYDDLHLLTGPFLLRPGGYISVDKGSGWVQIFASHVARIAYGYSSRPKVGSRRERRTIPFSERLRSTSTGTLPVGDRLRDRIERHVRETW